MADDRDLSPAISADCGIDIRIVGDAEAELRVLASRHHCTPAEMIAKCIATQRWNDEMIDQERLFLRDRPGRGSFRQLGRRALEGSES